MWRTKAFWLDAIDRAVRTAAQAALGGWVVGDVALNAFTLDWKLGAGLAGGGAILSLLTSLAGGAVGDPDTPALLSPAGKHAA